MAYLGEEIKKLGFGLMRLPQKSEGVIDVEQTKVMVDKFMEAGFTYFDTAWAYAGSEDAIREALVERYKNIYLGLLGNGLADLSCKYRNKQYCQRSACSAKCIGGKTNRDQRKQHQRRTMQGIADRYCHSRAAHC